MTSSLDWAGFVSAAAAAAQAAAVLVQVYWGQRQRGAGTTEDDDSGRTPRHGMVCLDDTRAVRVKVSVEAHDRISVTLVDPRADGAGGSGPTSMPAKGFRRGSG